MSRLTSRAIDDPEETFSSGSHSPEQRLAATFLLQILKDLTTTIDTGQDRAAFSSAVRAFTLPSETFEMFCWGVNLDPDSFRPKAIEVLRERAGFSCPDQQLADEAFTLASHVLEASEVERRRKNKIRAERVRDARRNAFETVHEATPRST